MEEKNNKSLGSKILDILGYIFMGLSILVMVFTISTSVGHDKRNDDKSIFGFRTYTVLTNSMEDTFKASGNAADVNEAKTTLAYELTKMVHGVEEADKAKTAAQSLFANGGNTADMPTTEMARADFETGMTILDVMLSAGLIPSKGEGRRLVQQGGVSVNNEKITDPFANIDLSMFENDEIIIKKGKKTYHKIVIK